MIFCWLGGGERRTDRYFQRVNAGVLDVVAKLEEVAKAMKGVEIESREIWGRLTARVEIALSLQA